MDSYRSLADEIARDIADGRLKPGDRLPPQRDYAYERGIAPSTAGRVYKELVRRGLVVGEVGRGSFVRAVPGQPVGAAAVATVEATATGLINLEASIPMIDGQDALMAEVLAGLARPEALAAVQALPRPGGTQATREAASAFLTRDDWRPALETILLAASGRRSIAGALAALAAPGEKVAVEALTYSMIKGLAARLGIILVPVALDPHGLRPDALAQVHREVGGVKAVYVQPSVHNPLSLTMPTSRRRDLAETLQRLDIVAIEDAVYGFLVPDLPPLAALAPDHVIHVDSLSKRVVPWFSLGLTVVPPRLRPAVAAALHTGGWTPTGLGLELGMVLMRDGIAASVSGRKLADVAARQALVGEQLAGLTVRTDPRSYHCWLELPPPWRAETFAAAAARRGIAVTPGAAFAVGPAHSPNAVRIALGIPPLPVLAEALATLRAIALGGPEGFAID